MKNEIQIWYQSDAAKTYREAQAHILHSLLPNCFGYYLAQLGGPENTQWLESSPIKQKIWVGERNRNNPQAEGSSDFSSYVLSEFDELPFLPGSIDVILLPHTLEYCANPDAVLKEAVQALIPEGYIIIFGFNPISFWGLRYFFRHKKDPEWLTHFLTMGKLRAYLGALDCEVDESKSFTGYNPAQSLTYRAIWEKRIRQRWHFFGGLYMIVARKQVAAITPIRLERRVLRVMNEREHDLARNSE